MPITHIAIVGGGTAGWMAAAAFSKALPKTEFKITLIETPEIPTVGVGEATIPPIEAFNKLLGINKYELLKATQGTFKLGIEFLNWGKLGDSYYHPFGVYGTYFDNVPFHQSWKRARSHQKASELETYSLNTLAARQAKFIEAQKVKNSPLATIHHAYHFDARLYAKYLRHYSEKMGVVRIEGKVNKVSLDSSNGFISQLHLDGGDVINADFFIDCTGFQGLLIEKALNTGYDDWSAYLPCNSAIAIPSQKSYPTPSHTKAIAHGFGWQWRIPLQHRVGNGFVYSNNFCSDAAAEKTLLSNLETEPLATPIQLRFTTGQRKKMWNKNCLALGLASGFLEPLESTSIHLIQSAISKFLGVFPNASSFEHEATRFNKLMNQEMLSIRDFLILHYKATQRDDTEFWNYCRNMPIPDSLQEKIDLYLSSAHLYKDHHELFSENSWLSVFEGQGITSNAYSSLAKQSSITVLAERIHKIGSIVKQCADAMPSHDEYIHKHCKAEKI